MESYSFDFNKDLCNITVDLKPIEQGIKINAFIDIFKDLPVVFV
jgi:hypothetical protein